MNHEGDGDGALDAAVQRLDRSVGQLELRLTEAVRQARSQAGGLFEDDRASLAAQLDEARGRERALEEAGAEASRALGRAITEIRAALDDGGAAAAKEEI